MTEELFRKSFLLQLIEKMQNADSWAGETHIQKTIYFLQKLFNVPISYKKRRGKGGISATDACSALNNPLLITLFFYYIMTDKKLYNLL